MFYRYLAVDDVGPFALLSYRRLERLFDKTVNLTLLEATEDWKAARVKVATPRSVPRIVDPEQKGSLASYCRQLL